MCGAFKHRIVSNQLNHSLPGPLSSLRVELADATSEEYLWGIAQQIRHLLLTDNCRRMRLLLYYFINSYITSFGHDHWSLKLSTIYALCTENKQNEIPIDTLLRLNNKFTNYLQTSDCLIFKWFHTMNNAINDCSKVYSVRACSCRRECAWSLKQPSRSIGRRYGRGVPLRNCPADTAHIVTGYKLR